MVKKRKIKVRAKKVVKKAKRVTKKAVKKAGAKRRKSPVKGAMEKIAEVTHYFPKVKAAAVKILKNSLKVGDSIYIKGHTTNFKEKVASIQLNHVKIAEGKKGDEIGLLVKSRVRIGDALYRV